MANVDLQSMKQEVDGKCKCDMKSGQYYLYIQELYRFVLYMFKYDQMCMCVCVREETYRHLWLVLQFPSLPEIWGHLAPSWERDRLNDQMPFRAVW